MDIQRLRYFIQLLWIQIKIKPYFTQKVKNHFCLFVCLFSSAKAKINSTVILTCIPAAVFESSFKYSKSFICRLRAWLVNIHIYRRMYHTCNVWKSKCISNLADDSHFTADTWCDPGAGGAFLRPQRIQGKQSPKRRRLPSCWRAHAPALQHIRCVWASTFAPLFREHKQLTRCFSQQM